MVELVALDQIPAFLYNASLNGGLFCFAFHGLRVRFRVRVGFRVSVRDLWLSIR